MNRRNWLLPAGLLLASSPPAFATGSEMAGLAAAIPILLAIAAVTLQLFCLLIESLLPRRWPRLVRWPVAALLGPVALAVAWIVYSAASYR